MTVKIFRRALRALEILITVILALLLAAEIYVLAAENIFKKQNATVFGFKTAVVLTGSMSGTIEPNDLIVTRRQKSYSVGDIITYSAVGTPVTHRITAETEDGFTTRGDANNTPDAETVRPKMIIGRVVLILPHIGVFIRFLRTPQGLLCIIAVILAAAAAREIIGRMKKN